LIFTFSFSQECERFVSTDSVNINESSYTKTLSLKTPYEEGQIQIALISLHGKYYLKIYTFKILYFDLISSLEIISENMSIVFKDVRMFKADHQRGVFILNVQKNYITTLKNHGITEIIFNSLKESVPKKTSKLIRQVSSCFLNQLNNQ
jgi:hypothetical protein